MVVQYMIRNLQGQTLGPYFFRLTFDKCFFTRATCCAFLVGDLTSIISMTSLQELWLLHDGAPYADSRLVTKIMNRKFPPRWMDRGGPVPLPVRSLDMQPFYFYCGVTLKTKCTEQNQRPTKTCHETFVAHITRLNYEC